MLRLLCWSYSSMLLLPMFSVLNTYSHVDEFGYDDLYSFDTRSYPGSLSSHFIVFSTSLSTLPCMITFSKDFYSCVSIHSE
ncbi:hypothetical protein RSAG8_09875, partial [Rhizoctonia solani AG-8 WAC10335]